MKSGDRTRQGFTLIELLVVIAIIAVLIALLLAGGAVGARGGTAGSVHQQPQADGPGAVQLREQQRCISAGVQVDQPDDGTAVGHVPRHRLQRPGPDSRLHGRGHAVQLDELRIRV